MSEMGVAFPSAGTPSHLCFKQITSAALLNIAGSEEQSREAWEEAVGIIQAKGDSGLDQAVNQVHVFTYSFYKSQLKVSFCQAGTVPNTLNVHKPLFASIKRWAE